MTIVTSEQPSPNAPTIDGATSAPRDALSDEALLSDSSAGATASAGVQDTTKRSRKLSTVWRVPILWRSILTLENIAHAATITGSVVAAFALFFGYQQFRETSELQREALRLERHTKLSEFHQRLVEISQSRAAPDATKEERDDHRFVRAQKALSILNGMHLASKDDNDWKQVIFWSLNNDPAIIYVVRNRYVNCLVLTPDFLAMVKSMSGAADLNICRDLNEVQ